MSLNDERDSKQVQALSLVLRAIASRKLEPHGTGGVTCPMCGFELKYSFIRTRGRRTQITYGAKCESDNCIELRGH